MCLSNCLLRWHGVREFLTTNWHSVLVVVDSADSVWADRVGLVVDHTTHAAHGRRSRWIRVHQVCVVNNYAVRIQGWSNSLFLSCKCSQQHHSHRILANYKTVKVLLLKMWKILYIILLSRKGKVYRFGGMPSGSFYWQQPQVVSIQLQSEQVARGGGV